MSNTESPVESASTRKIPYYSGESSPRSPRQTAGGRKEMIELLPRHVDDIVQGVGRVIVSAKEVLQCMQRLGHLKHVTKGNGVGDILGAKHFKLPYAEPTGFKGRFYLIPALTWDAETLASFHALPDEEKGKKARALEKELLGIDRGAPEAEEAQGTASPSVVASTPQPESAEVNDLSDCDVAAELDEPMTTAVAAEND